MATNDKDIVKEGITQASASVHWRKIEGCEGWTSDEVAPQLPTMPSPGRFWVLPLGGDDGYLVFNVRPDDDDDTLIDQTRTEKDAKELVTLYLEAQLIEHQMDELVVNHAPEED